MSKSAIDTLSMYVGTLGISIGPLLQTRFAMAELLTTHAAGSTLEFVCRVLCADSPLAASVPDLSTRCGNVVHKGSSWHRGVVITGRILPLGVIVSADRVSQLSVNDRGRVRAIPLQVASDRSLQAGTEPGLPLRLVLDLSTLWLVQK